MDTFVDSSWYFMRYTSPGNKEAMVDPRNDYWMPIDQYIGGIEHAILHLLYARFWTKAMRDIGLVKFSEPFKNLLCQGMVLNHIYYSRNDKDGKDYFPPDQVAPMLDAQGQISGGRLADGTELHYGGVGKMGKSERNGVDPQAMIEKYGADTSRLYMMFTAPPEASLEWNDAAVEGSWRFLKRVWDFGYRRESSIRPTKTAKLAEPPAPRGTQIVESRRQVYLALQQISFDFERIQYNTVVSGCMKILKALESVPFIGPVNDAAHFYRECYGILLRVLYPVCPHVTHRLWNDLEYGEYFLDGKGKPRQIVDAPWPEVDESALVTDSIELVLQINGKTRGSIVVASSADKATIEAAAGAAPEVEKFGEGRAPKKIIVVPGRLVNVVV